MSADFRIISLVPSLTDTCFAMGLGQCVAGRTDYCISPAEHMPNIPSVGGPKSVNAQAFRALHPTHVLVCPEENSRDIIPLTESCGAQLVSVDPKCPEDNHDIFRLFGKVFDCASIANTLSQKLEEALTAANTCKTNTPNLTGLPLIWRDPWMSLGPQTYGAAMLDSVGITVPRISDSAYPVIADIAKTAKALDALILTTEPYSFHQDSIQDIQALSGQKNVHLTAGENLAWYGSYAIHALHDLVIFKQHILDTRETTPMS